MKQIISLLLLFTASQITAQIKGHITDEAGNSLPFVNIYIENTYIGTTSNVDGKFELQTKGTQEGVLVFQFLGYKTQKISFTSQQTEILNIKLQEEDFKLQEVTVIASENPALAIIRNAIASKKENMEKTARFEADFYSRGILRLKNAPKKIMGQEIGDFNGALDSTGTGIIYLSETVSKIIFEKPDKLKERIIASKISGNDNGYSYNTARSSNYDFYENTLEFATPMISPIANNAFGYYNFYLESTFYDEHNHLINKIRVAPKRDLDPAFEGYIYIVEDQWMIYAAELKIKGYRMKEEFIDFMTIKQQFSYNTNTKIWSKNTQSLAFEAGAFGIIFSGNYNFVFSNYIFPETIIKNTFTREILSFAPEANKKDDTYWNTFRPMPLTEEEANDYLKKDSIQTLRKSKVYLDSIDQKSNKFKGFDVLMGYTYKNSYEGWNLRYEGLLKSINFNTVQGWQLNTGFSYTKRNEDTRRYFTTGLKLNYGFAEEKLRGTYYFNTRLNTRTNSFLNFSAGSEAVQFNAGNPISPLINTVSTLFFKDNYMKLYEKNFVRAGYQQEVVNGLFAATAIEYAERNPLINNTDYTFIKKDKAYTSNNPLDPANDDTNPFESHHLMKFNLNTRINFGQKYLSRPDGKFNIRNDKFPTLFIGYEKGFAGSESNYNYDFVGARLYYDKTVGNKGFFALNLKGGQFFNAENIAFADFRHFNGNQTQVNTSDRYLNVFNLLPYYTHSTNDRYFETHFEHNFNGFIMNKIPLLNKLKSNLILGYHQLSIVEQKPYQEFSIGLDNLGFGKFRFLRLDYVKSFNGSQAGSHGLIFGLKFLNIIE